MLLAAIFWGWLWGPVGLLLATPITVCLTVGGEFIPALRIFSIMFGSEDPLEGYLSFYNRLLLRDRTGAIAIADRYAEAATMEEMFNDLFIPTLTFAQEELDRKRITQAHDHFIKDVVRELIIRFGDRNAGTPDPTKHIVGRLRRRRAPLPRHADADAAPAQRRLLGRLLHRPAGTGAAWRSSTR